MDLGRLRHPYDLLVRRVRLAEGDVLPDGHREDEDVLKHDADLAPQRAEGDVADIVPVDQDPALGDVVEAGHQLGEGGLTRAHEPHEGDLLPRPDAQGDVPQRLLGALVGEGDVLELDGPPEPGQLEGVLRLGDIRAQVHDLEDAPGAGDGVLIELDEPGEHPHGADQLGEVGGEEDHLAYGEAPPQHPQPALDDDQRDADGDHRRGRGPVEGLYGRGLQGRAEVLAVLDVEPL